MEQKKIYVVTSGSYSDYHIVAVYDNKELAEKHKDLLRDGNDVEEYVLNEDADLAQRGLKEFNVRMLRDGEVEMASQWDIGRGEEECNLEDDEQYYWKNGEKIVTASYKVLRVKCFAKDKQHAIKIANEKRIQLIAANQW